jgi:hypothetical protein
MEYIIYAVISICNLNILSHQSKSVVILAIAGSLAPNLHFAIKVFGLAIGYNKIFTTQEITINTNLDWDQL